MTRPLKIALSTATAVAVVTLATLLYSPPSNATIRLPVRWDDQNISTTIKPGETQQFDATITASFDLPQMTVLVGPRLKPYVTAATATVGPIKKGKTATVSLVVSAPITTMPTSTDGFVVLALASTKPAFLLPLPRLLPVAVKIVWPVINGITVPPEPDRATNNATLAGVDLNSDGVRDDVERYIAMSVPTSARHREALRTIGKVAQKEFVEQTTAQAIENATAGVLSIDCLSYLGLLNTGTWKQVDALMVNTPARLAAMEAHSARISGQVFSTLPDAQARAACAFNVESLPN